MSMYESILKEEQSGIHSVSVRTFLTVIGMWTLLGLGVTSVIAYQAISIEATTLYLIFTLVLMFGGVFVAGFAKTAFWATFGYLMLSVGSGFLLGPSLNEFQTSAIIAAVWATVGVTVVASLIGVLYPKSLEHWGMYLFMALSGLVILRFVHVGMVIYGMDAQTWYFVDYFAVALFSMYIVYDWNCAVRTLDHTPTNAIRYAVHMFLNILNLFVSFLRILKR